MAVTVLEKWDSPELADGEQPALDQKYLIVGTDDELTARQELLNQTEATYAGLVRQSLHLERIAKGAWEASLKYGPLPTPQTGDSSYSFDTGGGSQKILQSLGTVGAWGANGAIAPNFGGAIGVTADSIDGVEITVPIYHFSETHYLDVALVTGDYKAALFGLTGTVNNGGFRGFAAGEVLFLGASGSVRGQENWEIGFKFAASPNAVGLVIGSITGINKRGWDYLWVRYIDVEDSAARMLVKRPLAAYVEQVYSYTDFGGLGIGT